MEGVKDIWHIFSEIGCFYTLFIYLSRKYSNDVFVAPNLLIDSHNSQVVALDDLFIELY